MKIKYIIVIYRFFKYLIPMNQDNFFMNNIEILQAISDWQISRNSKRARKIEKLSSKLPLKYRTLDITTVCYRRLDLQSLVMWELAAKERLEEKLASWTIDLNFAKNFNNGVPTRGQDKFGIIFKIIPQKFEMILNLNALYNCPDFNYALNFYKDQIKNYNKGAGKFKGTQYEIILKIQSISLSNVDALAGYSSLTEKDIKSYLIKHNLVIEDEILQAKIQELKNGMWLSESGAKNALQNYKVKVNKKLNCRN